MKTLVVQFEYLDRDNLYDAINGLADSLNMDPDDWDWTYTEEDDDGKEIIRYRRTCIKEKAMGKKTLRNRLEDSKQFVVIVDKVRIRRVSDPNEYFTVRDDRDENCIVFDYTPSGKPVVDWCFEDNLPNDDIVELCGEDSDEVFSIDMNSTDWELHPDDKAKINKRLEETLAELMVS